MSPQLQHHSSKCDKKTAKKIWVDNGNVFKESFKSLREKKSNEPIQQRVKNTDMNIGSFEGLIYEYLEDKWTYYYIDKLQ